MVRIPVVAVKFHNVYDYTIERHPWQVSENHKPRVHQSHVRGIVTALSMWYLAYHRLLYFHLQFLRFSRKYYKNKLQVLSIDFYTNICSDIAKGTILNMHYMHYVYAGAIIMALSKAFGTINHELLLAKLHFFFFFFMHFFFSGTKHPREDNPNLYYWAEITGLHTQTFNI